MPSAEPTSRALTAEGTYTEAELVAAEVRRRRTLSLGFSAAVTTLALLIALWLTMSSDEPWWLSAFAATFVVCLTAYSLTIGFQRTVWHEVRKRADLGSRVIFALEPARVLIETRLPTGETTRSELLWSEFVGIQERGAALVLHHQTGSEVLLPRRMFVDEETWDAARVLAAEKIKPRKRKGQRLELVTSAEVVDGPPDDPDAVRIDCRVMLSDLIAVTFAQHKFEKRRGILGWTLLIALCVTLLVMMEWADSSKSSAALGAGWWYAGGVAVAIAAVALVFVLIRWWYRRHDRLLMELSVVLAQDGVYSVASGEPKWGRMPWALFVAYGTTKERFWMDLGGQRYVIVPARCCAGPDDFAAAVRLAHRKLGRCSSCGYPLRGSDAEVCPECGAAVILPEDV